jgi:hypothetical protein
MKPSYDEVLKGNIQWREVHRDVSILLSFHGYRPDSDPVLYHSGIWCYYLLLDERMFKPKDWRKIWFKSKMTEFGLYFDYYSFPDVDFHGGITFYEQGNTYERKSGKKIKTIKVGCDYNHLWDSEVGYPACYETVLDDAKHSVDKLIEYFPNLNKRCEWSGIWDKPENFYVAKNGKNVHNSMKDTIEYDGWKSP